MYPIIIIKGTYNSANICTRINYFQINLIKLLKTELLTKQISVSSK